MIANWFASLLIPLWITPNLPSTSPIEMHEEAELFHASAYTKWATGNDQFAMDGWWSRPNHPWPVRVLSIGHSMASYQHYSGEAYFHHGIDIRADAGSDVIASAGGKVVNIENYVPGSSAYWEIAILDESGYLWQYHHVKRESIPREIIDAFNSGTPIREGTKIGEVYPWPVSSFGERFNHIHLNVIGKNENYLNPFLFLEPLADKKTPEILSVGLIDLKGLVKGQHVSGPYTLYAVVQDLILHDKFQLPPNRIWIAMDGQKPRTVWHFLKLPGGKSNTKFVNKFFIPKMTCGNYQCRRFTVNLGFHPDGQLAFPDKGAHSAIIGVSDFAGNTAGYRFDWIAQ